MPETKEEAQRVLQRFGIRGLKIYDIAEDRIFALTAPRLTEEDTMKRRAVTVVLEYVKENQVRALRLDGWVVD
jgi:hypothetical protein